MPARFYLMPALCALMAIELLIGLLPAEAQSVRPVVQPPAGGKTLHPTNSPQATTLVDDRLIAADNDFGFRLFGQLVRKEGIKNLFISPTSLALALQMTYNGARGQTQQAMAQTLGLGGLDLATVNGGNIAFLESLKHIDPEDSAHPMPPEYKTDLRIANALYAWRDRPLRPDFIQRVMHGYGAYLGDLEGAPDNINRWVSAKTNGKIPAIASPDDLHGGQTVAILVNAVYLKALWTTPFLPQMTKQEMFTLADGRQSPCWMMHQDSRWPMDQYAYLQGDHFQAIQLPYASGRLTMRIFLPDKQTPLADFLSQVTAENWKKWEAEYHTAEGDFAMPRFKVEYSAGLKEALTALGMGVACDPAQADFSGISSYRVWIDEVKHKTYIKVDEKGTEAAAATEVVLPLSIHDPPPTRFQMIVDRPFFCAIVDNKTGAILFLGIVATP